MPRRLAAGARRLAGGWLILASTFFFAAGNAATKVASAEMSAWETVFWRTVFGLATILVLVRARKTSLVFHNRRLLFYRALFGTVSLACFFFAIKHSGLAKATMLCYTYPLFAVIAAWAAFGERPRLAFWPLLALALGGAALAIAPDLNAVSGWDLVGLAGGVLAGGAIACVRGLGKSDSPTAIYVVFMSFAAAVSFVPALLEFRGHGTLTWLTAAASGVLTTFAQLLMSKGYQTATVGAGSLLSLQTITLAAIAGLVLGETLSWQVLAGCGAVLAAGTVSGLLKPLPAATQ